MLTRWRSPPESWVGNRVAQCAMPTSSSNASALSRRSPALRTAPNIAICTFSEAVSVGSKLKSWKIIPIAPARSLVQASLPGAR